MLGKHAKPVLVDRVNRQPIRSGFSYENALKDGPALTKVTPLVDIVTLTSKIDVGHAIVLP